MLPHTSPRVVVSPRMGAAKSKSASIVNASKPARALPRPGATPIAPYVPPDTFVQASPVDDARADDTALREMMSKLVVRTTDVSAVDYGYAPSPASAVKRREPPGTEALLKPRDVAEALERHRASAFSDAIVEEIARERRGKLDSKVLGLMMKHVRAHAYAEEEDERRPGGTLRVGRW